MSFPSVRRTADRVRDIPLEDVLVLVRAERDPCDRRKWRTDRGTLSITGPKFFNWRLGTGGGGAIDLVIHLEALDFRASVAWLAHRFPDSAPPQRDELSDPRPARSLTLPTPSAANLSVVTRYLTHKRYLDPAVVDALVKAGEIYADDRSNAVFLLLGDKQRPVGAEIRGTTTRPWRSMAPGSRRDLGYFAVAAEDSQTIVLCESAIDAMSCSILRPWSLCISTAGARPAPNWLGQLLSSPKAIYCGFDADPAGDRMAQAMIKLHPQVRRLRPPSHDWNDVLRARR